MSEKAETGRAAGGIARAAALPPERRREIASAAAKARHGRPPLKATHVGALPLGDPNITCYVLEDGTRVLSQRGLNDAFGIVHGGGKDRGQKLPRFAAVPAIIPYLSNDLTAGLHEPIRFTPPHGGNPVLGIPATALPDVCNAWLRAREKGEIKTDRHLFSAQKAEIIVRGLAHVGIIALVDEATGYQADREKDALAKILEAFIAKELQPYLSTFPVGFYQQMFRLRGIEFPGTVKRPQYFGVLTNDIVYKRLAPGVLDELKRLKAESGKSRDKLFQRLTANIGYPKLREHLGSVVSIMKLSDAWGDFMKKLDRIHPRYGDQMMLPYDGEDDGKGL